MPYVHEGRGLDMSVAESIGLYSPGARWSSLKKKRLEKVQGRETLVEHAVFFKGGRNSGGESRQNPSPGLRIGEGRLRPREHRVNLKTPSLR